MHLTVGLPGAGKTTGARQLAEEHNALRLTPDEWMMPLFGESDPDGKRDVMEGRMLWLALETLKLGTNVILDYGCWHRDERSAIRWLVESVGARCHLVYLPVDHETQLARVTHRQVTEPDQTFPADAAELLHWRSLFEVPDATELAGHKDPEESEDSEEFGERKLADPPPGWPGWFEWAAHRWPSFA